MTQLQQAMPQDLRRLLRGYLIGLLAVVVLLGLLHIFFRDVRMGGTSWFNLDRERNFATWFSGALFFIFGCSAVVAYALESRINAAQKLVFRLPVLWLGVALAGLYMSLDEITILHENLFWKEVRLASNERSEAWKYLTQWQILFAPVIALAFGYMVVFFTNRFGLSPWARRSAYTGIGCFVLALSLEAVRGTFRSAGSDWYSSQVVVEELLEMCGAIFLLEAIVVYLIDIGQNLTNERRKQLSRASQFLTRDAMTRLAMVGGALVVAAGVAFLFAQRQALSGDPVPGMFRRALSASSDRATPISNAMAGDIWFAEIASAGAPLRDEPQAIANYLQRRLFPHLGGRPTPPSGIRRDKRPRIVFLSQHTAGSRAQVVWGAAQGLSDALQLAMERAGFSQGFPADAAVTVDIVDGVDSERVAATPPLPIERGLHGVAFDRQTGIALTPAEAMANGVLTEKREIQPAQMIRYLADVRPEMANRLAELLQPRTPVSFRFFTTRAFYVDAERADALFRYHREFEDLSPEELLRSAIEAGRYLTRATQADGEFVYSFYPEFNASSDSYNMLRHAGTIYSMLELFAVTGDTELRAAIERATRYLIERIKPCEVEGVQHICVVDDDAIKLGGNALGAIALALYEQATGSTEHHDVMVGLGRWIQAVQGPDGEFKIHKQLYPSGRVTEFVSAYYPGEALLALSRIYDLEPDRSFIHTAEAGARWLIEVRDAGLSVEELNHDHWLLYALNDLYRHAPAELYLTHMDKICQAIINGQNRQPDMPDWRGSYYKPPRSTPTAIRSEGLAAAYALTKDFGSPERAQTILEAVDLGVRFQLQTQLEPALAMFYPDPQRVLGGFTRSLTNSEIRIDYVQHNISALLALRRILLEQAVDDDR